MCEYICIDIVCITKTEVSMLLTTKYCDNHTVNDYTIQMIHPNSVFV